MFPMMNAYLAAGIFVFARLLGFFRLAPVFNRKEIPSMVKLGLIFLLTIILTSVTKPDVHIIKESFALSILLNVVVGAMIGYIAQLILLAVDAGGDMVNMQMGLSSAMVLDPTTSSQVSIVGKCFQLLGLIIFIQLGGVYWLLTAFIHSFQIFPLDATLIPLQQLVNMDYMVQLSSNVLFMGLQIASPILLATLGQDIILGVISKTAPASKRFPIKLLIQACIGCGNYGMDFANACKYYF